MDLWTSLNMELLNDGKILGKYDEAATLAFQSILGAPYFGVDTPRILFLKAVREVLDEMPERVWNLQRHDLLFDSGDSDRDLDTEGQLGTDGLLNWVLPFVSSHSMRVCLSPSSSLHQHQGWERELVNPKKATTKKNSGWSSVARCMAIEACLISSHLISSVVTQENRWSLVS